MKSPILLISTILTVSSLTTSLLSVVSHSPKQAPRQLSVEAITIDQRDPNPNINQKMLNNVSPVSSIEKIRNLNALPKTREIERNLRQIRFLGNGRARNDLLNAFDSRFADFNDMRYGLDKNLIENDDILGRRDESFFR